MPQNTNQIQLDFLQESQHWWFWQVLLKGILRGIWQESDRFLKHNNSWPISLHRMISGENDPSPPQPTRLHCSFLPQVRQCLGARKCSRSTTTSYLCHPQCFVEFDGFLQAEKKRWQLCGTNWGVGSYQVFEHLFSADHTGPPPPAKFALNRLGHGAFPPGWRFVYSLIPPSMLSKLQVSGQETPNSVQLGF